MADFGYLKQLAITKDMTAELTLHEITVNDKSPTLVLGPATEDNKPYYNAVLKMASSNSSRIRAGKVNAGAVEEARVQDRELFPKFIIQNWYDMPDTDGSDVKFTREDCAQFIEALPGHVFDRIREFSGNVQNFVDDVVLDTEEVAGN